MANKTGLVRQLDDLGRVVIPKEIRQMMGVSAGDKLEFNYSTAKKSVEVKAWEDPVDFESLYLASKVEISMLEKKIEKLEKG